MARVLSWVKFLGTAACGREQKHRTRRETGYAHLVAIPGILGIVGEVVDGGLGCRQRLLVYRRCLGCCHAWRETVLFSVGDDGEGMSRAGAAVVVLRGDLVVGEKEGWGGRWGIYTP